MTKHTVPAAGVVLLLALVPAGCGSDDSGDTTSSAASAPATTQTPAATIEQTLTETTPATTTAAGADTMPARSDSALLTAMAGDVSSTVSSCGFATDGDFTKCQTLDELKASGASIDDGAKLPFGSGPGTVTVKGNGKKSYTITGTGVDGVTYTLTVPPGVRTCDKPGQGECKDDGTWFES
jgi:hypothetical protein